MPSVRNVIKGGAGLGCITRVGTSLVEGKADGGGGRAGRLHRAGAVSQAQQLVTQNLECADAFLNQGDLRRGSRPYMAAGRGSCLAQGDGGRYLLQGEPQDLSTADEGQPRRVRAV